MKPKVENEYQGLAGTSLSEPNLDCLTHLKQAYLKLEAINVFCQLDSKCYNEVIFYQNFWTGNLWFLVSPLANFQNGEWFHNGRLWDKNLIWASIFTEVWRLKWYLYTAWTVQQVENMQADLTYSVFQSSVSNPLWAALSSWVVRTVWPVFYCYSYNEGLVMK